jgi:hypothetical protein
MLIQNAYNQHANLIHVANITLLIFVHYTLYTYLLHGCRCCVISYWRLSFFLPHRRADVARMGRRTFSYATASVT